MVTADRYVVALAAHGPALLRPLGIDIPVYPVKGYSLTAQIADPSRSPVSTLLDETCMIAITRLCYRIRVGGLSVISCFSTVLPLLLLASLVHFLSALFLVASRSFLLSFS